MLEARRCGKAKLASCAWNGNLQKRLLRRQLVHPFGVVAHKRDLVRQRHVRTAVTRVAHRGDLVIILLSGFGVGMQTAVGIREHPDVDIARVARIDKPLFRVSNSVMEPGV